MNWTRDVILGMAQVSDFHVAGAIEDWYRVMPKSAQEFPIQSGEGWPLLSTKRHVERFVEDEVKQAQILAHSLIASDITLWEWEFFMIERLQVVHIIVGLIGALGLKEWDEGAKRMVRNNLVFNITRLRNFGLAISKGRLTDKAMTARAMMYPMSGNIAYEGIRRRTAKLASATHERRLMAQRESCEDCSAAANKGWQRIGSLPPIGQSRCIVRCLCRLDFK